MGFLDSLFGKKGGMGPGLTSQRWADAGRLWQQMVLADQIKAALGAAGQLGISASQRLGRRGQLDRDLGSEIGRELWNQEVARRGQYGRRAKMAGLPAGALAEVGQAAGRGFRTLRRQRGSDIAQSAELRRRSDLASIFGKVLTQGVQNALANTGSVSERKPKRSTFEKFLGGATGVFGAFGG